MSVFHLPVTACEWARKHTHTHTHTNTHTHACAHTTIAADDEWVRVMGEAVGSFDGQLNLQSICEGSTLVRDTLANLKAGVPSVRPPSGFLPLQVCVCVCCVCVCVCACVTCIEFKCIAHWSAATLCVTLASLKQVWVCADRSLYVQNVCTCECVCVCVS